MSPLLSVVIPVYNCESTLKDLLQSLSQSNFKDFEVVVVDDGSSDKTIEVARRHNARVIQQENNQGPGASRNTGAHASKGEFVLFLDSDTTVFPDTLSGIVETLQRDDVDVVLGVYDKEPLNEGFFPAFYALLKHYAQSAERITHYDVFASHCAAICRSVFLESKGFHNFPKGVDIENEVFGRRLFNMGCNIVFEPSIRVRHHFAGFSKLIFIFVSRTFWWMRFFLLTRKFEKSLTTKSFGLGTLACPAGIFLLIAAIAITSPWASIALSCLAGISLIFFYSSYAGFLSFCYKERGFIFTLKSFFSCVFFSFLISYGAVKGLASALLHVFRPKQLELAMADILQSADR